MIRLSLRQFRTQGYLAIGLLVLVAIAAGRHRPALRPHL